MSVEGFLISLSFSLLTPARTLGARARDVVGFTLFGATFGTFEILEGKGAFVAAGALVATGALAGVLLGVLLAALAGVRAVPFASFFIGVLPGVFACTVVEVLDLDNTFVSFSSSVWSRSGMAEPIDSKSSSSLSIADMDSSRRMVDFEELLDARRIEAKKWSRRIC